MTKAKPMPDYLRAAKANLNAPEGITIEQYTARATAAQAQATVALAEELRTANLIALYSMDDDARQGMVDGAGLHSGNWVDVTKQIKERLGLA